MVQVTSSPPARNDYVNRVRRADIVLRLNVARRLSEPVEPVKLFPGVSLSETAAHSAGLVRAARCSQRPLGRGLAAL